MKKSDDKVYPTCIYFLGPENIAFGTMNHGIGVLNLKSSEVNYYNKTNSGFPSNAVHSIISSGRNLYWVSSDKGLMRIDLNNKTIKQFKIDDGLQGNDFNRGAAMRDHQGYLWYGGLGGLNYFHPDSIETKVSTASCEIQKVEIFGKEYYASGKDLVLEHDENYLNFSFHSNEMFNQNINFAYKLEGLDPSWNYTKDNNIASYTGISPGEYTLIATPVQNNIGATTDMAKLKIIIRQPWWYTSEMKGFYAVSLLVLGWSGVRIYTRQKVRKQLAEYEKQKAVDDERKRIAQDLHDDIGSTLGSISMYSEVAKKRLERKSGNPDEIIQKIGETSREMIEKMSDLVWSVNPENDSTSKLILRIKNFAALMLTPANIQQSFQIDEAFDSVRLSTVDRKNLFLIFKELIYNCLKYSKATHFYVEVRKEDRWQITVYDDGVGVEIEKSNAYNGNGMNNIIARAKEMGCEVEFSSSHQSGFKTVIRFRE